MAEERTRLFMEKGGVLKELSVERLPEEVVSILDKAYQHSKVVGISRRKYREMAEMISPQLAAYSSELPKLQEPSNRHRLFASCLQIDSNNCPLLMDAMLWVDVMAEDRIFTSRNVNMRNVKEFLRNYRSEACSYGRLQKEFREWDGPFSSCGGVGFIKLLKFYYSLITCPALATA